MRSIVNNYLFRDTEPIDDMLLDEGHNFTVANVGQRHNFSPFGEVIYRNDYILKVVGYLW